MVTDILKFLKGDLFIADQNSHSITLSNGKKMSAYYFHRMRGVIKALAFHDNDSSPQTQEMRILFSEYKKSIQKTHAQIESIEIEKHQLRLKRINEEYENKIAPLVDLVNNTTAYKKTIKKILSTSCRVIQFGKYKGGIMRDISKNDPAYIDWLIDTVEPLSLIQYVEKHKVTDNHPNEWMTDLYEI